MQLPETDRQTRQSAVLVYKQALGYFPILGHSCSIERSAGCHVRAGNAGFITEAVRVGGGAGGEVQGGEVQGLPQASHMMITVGNAALQVCKSTKERRLCVERLHSFQLSHSLLRVVTARDSRASCASTCGCRRLHCSPVKHILEVTGRKASPAFLFQLYCREISQCFHACGSGTTY